MQIIDNINLKSIGSSIAGSDELVTELRIKEGIGSAAALRDGHDLDGQVRNVLREGHQRIQRCLPFRRIHQNEAVHQIIPI